MKFQAIDINGKIVEFEAFSWEAAEARAKKLDLAGLGEMVGEYSIKTRMPL